MRTVTQGAPCALRAAPWVVLLAALVAGGAGSVADAQGPSAPSEPMVPALDGRLRVPSGFKVDYFARNLRGVRFMALGPDKAVYASQPGANRVVRLVDADRDGAADSVITAVDQGLNQPHGLAFHNGWLYIANTDGVVRVRLGPDGRAAGAPEQLNHYSGGGSHWSRTIIFGPDGAMYVAIGSSCNVCIERDSDRAAVMRYDENGKNGRLFARGLRNAVGLAVHPDTKEIWASQHERDMLLPDWENLPPEEINILRAGGDYGWPYCHSDRVPNPEYHDRARCNRTIPPALKMQAHSAPMGLAFLKDATQFPAQYRGDALLAFHGSWNRRVPTGAKVVRIRVRDGRPIGYEDFVTGWQRPDGGRWGRPVDVLVYKDGSVLISDDSGGAIFRVYQ